MLKIKWTDRITNGKVFQWEKEKRLLLKIKKNRRHSWIGHTVRHNGSVVNVLEGAIFGKKVVGRPRLQYLTLNLLAPTTVGARINPKATNVIYIYIYI